MKKFFEANKKNIIILLILISITLTVFITAFTIMNPGGKKAEIIDSSYKEIEDKNESSLSALLKEYIEVEIGTELPTIEQYFSKQEDINSEEENYTISYYVNNQEISVSDFTTIIEEKNIINKLGTYKVEISHNDKKEISSLRVIDNTPPDVTLKNVTIQEGTKYTAKSFVDVYNDNSNNDNYTISYLDSSHSSLNKVGTYDIALKICDTSKNCIEKNTILIIEKFVLTKVNTITQEIVLREETLKYGVKKIIKSDITYDVYNDGSKKESNRSPERTEIDQSTYNGTVASMTAEGIETFNILGATREAVLTKTNEYRTEIGVNPLQLDNTLSTMATIRAMELAYSGKFSHTRPDGRAWSTMWIDYLGSEPPGAIIGENLAYGYANDVAACEGWRASDGHYANMINKDFNKLGVGKYSFNGRTYWVQLFQS